MFKGSMKSLSRISLPLLVPVLGILYGAGDFFHIWDQLTGREYALAAYERFSSNKNFPTIIIHDNEPEFMGVYRFIVNHTGSVEVRELHSKKIFPQHMVRVGGTMGHDIEKDSPKTWPSPRFVPEASPVAFIYPKVSDKDVIFRVSSVGEIKQWAEKSRETERFWVTTILIGLLSIIMVVIEQLRTNDRAA